MSGVIAQHVEKLRYIHLNPVQRGLGDTTGRLGVESSSSVSEGKADPAEIQCASTREKTRASAQAAIAAGARDNISPKGGWNVPDHRIKQGNKGPEVGMSGP